ncbi:MAG: dockerin type I repeat-containing protein [Firmicutes bacterium]|nr:dockerin type I repeat-containing protein [Bacillota bacterium]
MGKKSKVLALLLCFAVIISAMPIMALADTPPITITNIDVSDDGDALNVVVSYDVDATVGNQVTILATINGYFDANSDEDDIAYIDQIDNPGAGSNTFEFAVSKDRMGIAAAIFVKIGGTDVDTPGALSEEFAGEVVIVFGDVNGDGDVDAVDAGLVLAYFVGNRTDFPDAAHGLEAADVNDDGDIDAVDAGLILAVFVGNREKFPIEEN